MEYKFHTSYSNRPTPNGEVGSPVDIVERVGYISLQQQIRSLQRAGQQLVLARAEQFDFENYDFNKEEFYDSIDFDPTTRKSFDFAEAFALQQRLRNTAIQRASQSTSASITPEKEVVNESQQQEQQPEASSVEQ